MFSHYILFVLVFILNYHFRSTFFIGCILIELDSEVIPSCLIPHIALIYKMKPLIQNCYYNRKQHSTIE